MTNKKENEMTDRERMDFRVRVVREHLNVIKRSADVCSDFLDRLVEATHGKRDAFLDGVDREDLDADGVAGF